MRNTRGHRGFILFLCEMRVFQNLFELVSIGLCIEKQKIVSRFTKENEFEMVLTG